MSKFVIHPNLRVLHLCNSVMHLPTIHIAKSVMRLDQKNEHQNNTKTIHSCVDVFIYFVLASLVMVQLPKKLSTNWLIISVLGPTVGPTLWDNPSALIV